ncbi:MAG: PilN domain-containing protein [Anaerolineales bacterium]|nr:PilN domain-containing protein [Anaerolineales bacterium]
MDDPKQLNGETQNQPIALTGSIALFDINILPERYRRKRIRLVNILPWVIFIILLGTLYPVGIIALDAQSQFIQSKSDLALVQSRMENYQSASEEMDSLTSEIETTTQLRDQILASYQGIDLQGTNWSESLFRIQEIIPEGISLTLVSQFEDQIQLNGVSESYDNILDFEGRLSGLDAVSNAQIDSVELIIEEEQEPAVPAVEDESGLTGSQNPSYLFTILIISSGEEGLP